MGAVADQVGDGADLQTMPRRVLLELGPPRHGAVGAHDLDDHAGGLETREQRQIDRRLGVTGAHQHATRLRLQREHVSGLVQVVRFRVRAHRGADGVGAVVGGNAGADALGGLDRDGERGAVTRGVVLHHRRQTQLLAAFGGQRQADQAARLACHEVDVLGPHQFRGHEQVALVLAILVVEHDDHAAGADLVDQFGNRAETHGGLTCRGAKDSRRPGRIVSIDGAPRRRPRFDSWTP